MSEQISTLWLCGYVVKEAAALREPLKEQAPVRNCSLWGIHARALHLLCLKNYILWERPTLDQFVKDYIPWKRAYFLAWEGRTDSRNPIRGQLSCYCYEMTTIPFPIPLRHLGEGSRGVMNEVVPRKEDGRRGF